MGFIPPPCNNSHGKSSHFFNFRFSLFTPLLVLFLLIMGNSPAWASTSTSYFTPGATIYFHVTNSCKDWGNNGNVFQVILFDKDDNTKAIKTDNSTTIMDACNEHDDNLYNFTGSGHYIASDVRRSTTKINDNYYSFTIPASGKNVGFIRLIKNDSDHDGWVHQSQNQFSADDISANKNCFAFSAWENGTVSLEEYSGGATVTTGSGGGAPEPVQTNWSLHGDMWLNGTADNAGWIGGNDPRVPHFMDNGDGTATCSFIFPNAQCRLELYENENVKTSDRCDGTTNLTKSNFNSNKYYFDATGSTKKYTFKINTSTGRFTASAEAYPVQKTGWHVFLSAGDGDPTEVGTITEEDGLVISNVSSGNHNLFITDGSANTIAGVNWFGGLYIDKTNSNVAWATQREYYGDNKFSSTHFPIRGKRNATGRFRLEEASDIIVAFDGGKITINKVEDATPAVKYTVTLHPNNGGSNIVRTNVPEGSTTSAAELNLAAVTYGVGTATWYTDVACTTPFTTVIGDMDLYAKWGVSGNYYFVSSLQTASDAGETGNWNSGWAKQLNYTSGNPGKCSYSFIAPAGRLPFELLTSTSDWNSIGADNNLINNDASNVTVAVLGGHFYFELPEPKKVTISYDGKVSVNVEDYNFDNTKTWHIKTSWASSGGGDWNYNTVLTNSTNGGSVVLPVQAGDRSFIISTKTNDPDAQQVVGTETFNALYVDTSNPSSGFRWRMTGAKLEGSGNFNKQLPQADGNYWRNCAFHVDANCDIRITFDGGKIRCDIVAPNIVTFKDGETTLSTQEVSNGGKATQPTNPTKAGYTFVEWQLDGSKYDFSNAVNSNITLNAVWAYKAIESVSLNESEHMTWVGNSDFTLTPTYSPSDVITKTVTWSSNNESVATVNNDGIVHAVGAGTATITCTVTDQYDTKKTATCEVTVAACEMATDNIYSMTVTGYNTSIGHNANLAGLWNESTENGVMTKTARLVRIAFKDLATEYMTEDANGKIAGRASITDNSDKWMYYSAGTDFFYLQNYKTGHYLYKDKSTNLMGQNGEWKFYGTKAAAYSDADTYRWIENGTGDQLRICNKDSYNGNLNGSHTLMRYYVDAVEGWNTPYVRCGLGGHQGNNPIRAIITQVEPSVSNPFFVASLMNGSYYRMKENATVQANLNAALVSGAVITVRLYADAATSVQLTKADGTEVNTIPLAADTEFEYSYTVNNTSPLLGESAFVIKAADNHAGIASIVVTRTYAIRLAQLIEETESGGTLTLTCDYATDNAVINKAITINGQGHTIGDLTVEYAGDLTLSSELTVRDFTIWAKAGNTSIPAASGQVRNASELNVNGNAYFLYTVDPSGEVQYGWYDFTVPFPINIVSGIKGIQEGVLKEDFRNGVDYAVMEYFGEKQAQGQYPYKKFSGVMQPKKLYTITLSNYNTLRMQKTADGALVASDEVTLNAYAGDDINKNWNGVGNGTLHHADADNLSAGYVQVYQSGSKTFLPVIKNDYSFVVGTAFMVQETGTMTLSQATHGALLAPSRYESAPATAIQIASEGKPFSDQLFITASETGGQAYTPGVDVAKAGELGSANVPQIWTNAYNSSLCVHEAQLINGKAQYKLSIYAPVAGSYTLTSKNIPADYSLYLTQNGMIVSELSDTYTLDLSKGITTEYGLLLTEIYNSPTGIENTQTDKIQTTKIIRNGVLYILHNGKVYNAQGAKVK